MEFINKQKNISSEAEEKKNFLDIEMKKKMSTLEGRIRRETSQFYHSSSLFEIPSKDGVIKFDARDFLLACAMTKANVLFIGESGSGKTELTEIFMNAVFGKKNTSKLVISPSLTVTQLVDMSFAPLTSGGNLSDTQKLTPLITSPATLLDELNRTPPQLLSALQPYMEGRSINLEGGRTATPGILLSDGSYYKWITATANPNNYSGVFELDEAVLNRFPVTIPWDLFPATMEDIINMTSNSKFENKKMGNNSDTAIPENTLDPDLEYLYINVKNIPMQSLASSVIWYLINKDNCYRASTGIKKEIMNFDPGKTCNGCKANGMHSQMCGNIGNISNRIAGNMTDLAKATAAIRSYKLGEDNIEVKPEDIIAIAPFLLYGGKIRIETGWIEKYAGGVEGLAPSLWTAISLAVENMSKIAIENTISLARSPSEESLEEMLKQSPASFSNNAVRDYYKKLRRLGEEEYIHEKFRRLGE